MLIQIITIMKKNIIFILATALALPCLAQEEQMQVPCEEEAIQLQKEGNLAVSSMSTAQMSMEDAYRIANITAFAQLTNRYTNIINHAISLYCNDVFGENSDLEKKAQVENAVLPATTKVLELTNSNVACRQFSRDSYGMTRCFLATYIPVEKLIDNIASCIDSSTIDKEKFLTHLKTAFAE